MTPPTMAPVLVDEPPSSVPLLSCPVVDTSVVVLLLPAAPSAGGGPEGLGVAAAAGLGLAPAGVVAAPSGQGMLPPLHSTSPGICSLRRHTGVCSVAGTAPHTSVSSSVLRQARGGRRTRGMSEEGSSQAHA